MLLPGQQSEKVKIMQRILQNDALILFLSEPWRFNGEQTYAEGTYTLH
jgi:hypothetical protein